jgi:Tol biopolymer transport system component
MDDYRSTLERELERLSPPRVPIDQLRRRRDRKYRDQRIRAGVLGLGIAIAVAWWGIDAIRSTPVPAVPPEPPAADLGIFAPVAGRIVYGDRNGLWGVDPAAPSDPAARVQLTSEPGLPLGWSSDGTELLFYRTSNDVFPDEYLFVLRADGTEIQLNDKPMVLAGEAAISPDGSRVAFARQAGRTSINGLYVVDTTGGGRPVRLVSPGTHGGPSSPTFSPDGAQIAYYTLEGDGAEIPVETHVWVMDSGGGNAHEILTDQAPLMGGPHSSLQWSPTGDRLVLQIDPILGGDAAVYGDSVIFTFAPDGSAFTQVITGGLSPYWSPDGSQIAYTIDCRPDLSCSHLAIAEADGSNIRGFGFAASGPWHPGNVIAVEPQPTPVEPQPEPILRGAGYESWRGGSYDCDCDLFG